MDMNINIDVNKLLSTLDKAADNCLDLCNSYYDVDDRKHKIYGDELDDILDFIASIRNNLTVNKPTREGE